MLMQIRTATRSSHRHSEPSAGAGQCEIAATPSLLPLFIFYLAMITIWVITP